MNITEIKEIDDLIETLSFNGAFSLNELESDYGIDLLSNFQDSINNFNNSVDTAFFRFQSLLKRVEQQYQEEYINYFDYKFKKRLRELKIYSGNKEDFYSFLKNKHGF